MALNKVLNKIQLQIDELTPLLELFVDASVQPSVEDCDKLRQNLYKVLENLAIYKHQKLNKEISPSFNIHAMVSEKEKEVSPEIAQFEKIKETDQTLRNVIPQELQSIPHETTKPTVKKAGQSLSIGLNDKFRFINELFSQNASEYNIAVEQLISLQSWPETEVYLHSLKGLYSWKDNNEVVKHFYSITKKRFD